MRHAIVHVCVVCALCMPGMQLVVHVCVSQQVCRCVCVCACVCMHPHECTLAHILVLYVFQIIIVNLCFVVVWYNAASNPVCSKNISGNTITVGQSVLMTCNVTYNASANTLSPSMTWSGQPPITPSHSNSTNYVSSTLIVPVTSANIPYVSYNCTTTIIMLSTPGSSVDNSIPPYSSSSTFPQLLVLCKYY